MPNVPKLLIAILVAGALAACQKSAPQPDANAIAADNNAAAQTSFDTLPADESSTTPSNQLQNGFDDSGVSDLNTVNSQ